jgi:dTDP-glucose 4,6-dehydratase
MDFESGLQATVDWYRANQVWVQHVRSGEYLKYYALNYEDRNRALSGITSS